MRYWFMACAFLLSSGAHVGAEELICDDPVTNSAIIGFPPGATVVMYEDPGAHTCRFSVDGWSAGSPPRDALQAAQRHIASNLADFINTRGAKDNGLAPAIGFLLAAASPFDSGDPRLQQPPYSDAIGACLANYPDADRRPVRAYSDANATLDGFWCAVADPRLATGAEGRTGMLSELKDLFSREVESGITFVELTSPYLIIRNDREGGREYLFMALPGV
ncbi:hypothetical protein GCM10023067_10940 [Aminobacter aganoensis]